VYSTSQGIPRWLNPAFSWPPRPGAVHAAERHVEEKHTWSIEVLWVRDIRG